MNLRPLAHTISALLHPFLMPTLVYYLILDIYFKQLFQFQDYGLISFLGLILMTTCILPAVTIYIMYKYDIIEDYNLIKRNDRLIPNITTICIYLITYVLFKYVNHLNGIILLPILYISISLTIFTIISLFWKISAHATGAGGTLGFWVCCHFYIPQQIGFYPLLLFIILVGSLLSSRLYLGRHTSAQVWSGLTLGFTVACVGLVYHFN